MLRPRVGRAPESYYEPRRRDFAAGCAVTGGVFTALYFGVSRWVVLLKGVRRLDPTKGLGGLELAVLRGALLGAFVGGATGWLAGLFWERWHRRRRAGRQTA